MYNKQALMSYYSSKGGEQTTPGQSGGSRLTGSKPPHKVPGHNLCIRPESGGCGGAGKGVRGRGEGEGVRGKGM